MTVAFRPWSGLKGMRYVQLKRRAVEHPHREPVRLRTSDELGIALDRHRSRAMHAE